ncbi:angiopoietin-4-like [Branchiostoma floridae x Branchiostoma belcheri]
MTKISLSLYLVTGILLLTSSLALSSAVSPQTQHIEDETVNSKSAGKVLQETPQQHTEVEDHGHRNNIPLGAAHFQDCASLFPLLYWTNAMQDGVFSIQTSTGSSTDQFDVYCDMTTDGGGWTVIQRRINGTLNFDRRWADYKNGFGRVEGEHWLGLDKIYNLTSQNSYELYVELEDWEGNFAHAKYDTFSIGDESADYTLNIGGYSGDAGDSMNSQYNNGRKFSARETDNDEAGHDCAQLFSGGWWYSNCGYSALNAAYFQPEDYHGADTGYGVLWYHWKNSLYSPLKATKMMVRPRNFVQKLLLCNYS